MSNSWTKTKTVDFQLCSFCFAPGDFSRLGFWEVGVGYLKSPTGGRGGRWLVWSTDLSLVLGPKHMLPWQLYPEPLACPLSSLKHRHYLNQTVEVTKKTYRGGSQDLLSQGLLSSVRAEWLDTICSVRIFSLVNL